MSPRTKFMVISSIFVAVLQFTCGRAGAQTNDAEEFQPGKIFADIAIATNSVEHGLTQTESNPAVEAQLGYKWTQFRLGLKAGNVKFDTSPETSNLRFFMAYKFIFSRNANLTARYDVNKYYNGSSRNGSISAADLSVFDFHVTSERIQNWEATEADTIRYGFFRDFALNDEAGWGLGAGYNMVGDENLENYFDIRASISYTVAELKYELIGTYNSKPDLFPGRGGPFAFLRFSASF